jgi:hypothetical protein
LAGANHEADIIDPFWRESYLTKNPCCACVVSA